MKTRDSGMPDEELWASFFAPAKEIAMLGLNADIGNAADFGCGYGTFAVPAAKVVRGTVYALDIDPAMVAATRQGRTPREYEMWRQTQEISLRAAPGFPMPPSIT